MLQKLGTTIVGKEACDLQSATMGCPWDYDVRTLVPPHVPCWPFVYISVLIVFVLL